MISSLKKILIISMAQTIGQKSHCKIQKCRWNDNYGNKLSAGGILFYDDKGIWTVGEKNSKDEIVYSDPGGKYNYEDCDILKTIVRELSEETYNTIEITRLQLKKVIEENNISPIYVYANGKATYICYVIPISLMKNIFFDYEKFRIERDVTITHNPQMKTKYIVHEIRHITYEELKNEDVPLSFRLKRIITLHKTLKTKIYGKQELFRKMLSGNLSR